MAKKLIIFSKYNYVPKFRKVSEKTDTVPDLVMSMAEIYRKYAVTGDITQLPGKVRPYSFDNGDEFDDSFESEEMTDTLLHSQEVRSRAISEAKKAEEKSYTKKTPEVQGDDSPAPSGAAAENEEKPADPVSEDNGKK